MRKCYLSFFLLLYLTCLSLQLASILTSKWASYNQEDFSITHCSSCEGLKSSWTIECLAREVCEKDSENCSSLTNYFNAGRIFTYLQIFSMFFCVLIVEKLFLMITSSPSGSLLFFQVFSVCHLGSQVAALITWFSITSADFSSCLVGVSLSISAVFISFFAAVISNWALFKGKNEEEMPVIYEEGKLCGINARIHLLIGLILGIMALALIFNGITNENWIIGNDFEGSLSRCKDCLSVKWMNWDCVQGFECEINSNSKDCKTFQDISKSIKFFSPLITLSVLFLMLSFQQGAACLISYQYGWTFMGQVYVFLALLFDLSATLVFALISGVKIAGDCEDELCGGNGFIVIFVSNLFILAYLAIYSVVRPRITNIKFFSVTTFDKTMNVTGRRDSLYNAQLDLRGNKVMHEVPDSNFSEMELQETSRRGSSAELVKYNTMNPEYANLPPIPK